MKVLVIEDDVEITECIKLSFKIGWQNAKIMTTAHGKKGLTLVDEFSPEVVLLDLGLPDISGFDVLKQIRQFSTVPVIIMTVKSEEMDIVRGLELGADEYLVKPFGKIELLARVKAMLRRSKPTMDKTSFIYGPFEFTYSFRKVKYKDKEVSLTATEGIILKMLIENSGQIVGYETLAERIWGEYYPGAIESLRVYMSRLRKKIGDSHDNPSVIIGHPNMGYSIAK